MNHCGQSPLVSYCCAKIDAQDLFDGLVMFQREQEFDRPLADVAGSPGGAGILFEPVRHGQMDHGVVGEPRDTAYRERHPRCHRHEMRRLRVTRFQ